MADNTYVALKEIARSMKCSVRDLLALSPANDPFAAAMDGRAEAGRWFAEQWQANGRPGLHLRAMHYLLMSKQVLKPNGTKYSNSDDDWGFLGRASLAARYLELIDPSELDDHRNAETQVFDDTMMHQRDEDVSCWVRDTDAAVAVPAAPDMPPLPNFAGYIDPPQQDYIVEVWCEKTSVSWLSAFCRQRHVNLWTGSGQNSEVRARQLAEAARKYTRPVRVLYISDFDPSGRSMPPAAARKMEFWVLARSYNIDLQLIPLALLPEQVRQFNLPPAPPKEKHGNSFKKKFGLGGVVELDALEALHPGELRKILDREIDRFIDGTLQHRFHRKQEELLLTLEKIEQEVHARYADEIAQAQEDLDEISDIIEDANERAAEWQTTHADLWKRIARDLAQRRPDLSDFDVPQSNAPGETTRFVLYDSSRSYPEQMQYYLQWRAGTEADDNE